MDYKQKYEQAMLRMNKWVEGSEIIDPKEVAEFVFPELKESEDERIKEDLIQWINEFPDVIWRGHNTKDVIAWLEKQDPKKHEEELEKAYKTADEVQYRRGYEAAKREFEKQGEQKSNWSEEDEQTFNTVIEKGDLKPSEIDWLKSIKQRMKEK